eukprot:188851-Chlamydomonas_euryale.AAC.1
MDGGHAVVLISHGAKLVGGSRPHLLLSSFCHSHLLSHLLSHLPAPAFYAAHPAAHACRPHACPPPSASVNSAGRHPAALTSVANHTFQPH